MLTNSVKVGSGGTESLQVTTSLYPIISDKAWPSYSLAIYQFILYLTKYTEKTAGSFL